MKIKLKDPVPRNMVKKVNPGLSQISASTVFSTKNMHLETTKYC